MSDKKISQLPSASTPLTGAEVLPVVQSSVTDQVSVANLTAGRVPAMNNAAMGYTATTAAAGTTTLTATSNHIQKLSGSTTQTFKLPDATTVTAGTAYLFDNDSSGLLTVVDNASGAVTTVAAGSTQYVFLETAGTVAGSWGKYAWIGGAGALSVTAAKSASITNSLTLSGTDSTTMTFPSTSATIARTDAANTFTGTQTFSSDLVANGMTVGKGGGALTESTAVGKNALSAVTSGAGNTGLGYSALSSASTAARNTAVGGYSQYSASGDNNTTVGYYAGPFATGAYNTLIGMNVATSGSFSSGNNTIVGANGGKNTTSGSSNSYFGAATGYSTTTGYANVAVGADFPGNYAEAALYSNLTGIGNTAIGTSALRLATAGYNTALGLAAGTTITSGTQNIYLGAYAGASGATATNETVIGYNLAGNGSNTVTIGNNSVTGVYLGTGANLVVGNGKGIDFSATPQPAGMTSELLADYEEGTWTPNQGSGLTLTGAFTSNGHYTKVGRLVWVRGYVNGATNVAVAAAGIVCTNLPFTAGQDAVGSATNGSVNLTSAVYVTSTTIYNATAIPASNGYYFSATYMV